MDLEPELLLTITYNINESYSHNLYNSFTITVSLREVSFED